MKKIRIIQRFISKEKNKKMNGILDLIVPIDTIDDTLDDTVDSFPEQTRRAFENIAKYGLPKDWQEEFDQIKREKSFWVRGVLHQVNAETNTFVIVGKAAGNLPIKHYTVTVSSAEILTQVVKTYWNEIVKVNVKPTNQEAESDELEFIRAVPSDNMILKSKQLQTVEAPPQ